MSASSSVATKNLLAACTVANASLSGVRARLLLLAACAAANRIGKLNQQLKLRLAACAAANLYKPLVYCGGILLTAYAAVDDNLRTQLPGCPAAIS